MGLAVYCGLVSAASQGSDRDKPVVAVVGSGPSGMYAADALLEQGLCVDVIDRLPVPFGLVRYGVAPDHLSIRSVRDTLDQIWEKPGIRFLGNIEVGSDISIAELQDAYHAVVLTYGASADRHLGIAREELAGSVAATDLVAWYTGHPDYRGPDFDDILPTVRRVAVIGVGNVAIDVVRVLSKSREELALTDMPRHVLDTLARAPIEHVYLLGRRGPVQASFTTKELKELGELSEADIRIHPNDLELDSWSASEVESNKVATRNLAVLQEWAQRQPRADVARVIDVRFFTRPTELCGTERVDALKVERTSLNSDGRLEGTGDVEELPVDLVVRSVGYRGTPVAGVPFDAERNVIPNVDGRVVDGSTVLTGLYCAGWIKRGPTGIIGTNKKCAVGTVAALVEDWQSGVLSGPFGSPSIDDLIQQRGLQVVSSQGWRNIDEAEKARGSREGRPRVTIHQREELLAVGVNPAST
jgi:ferredoxin--NADP+ reductase